MNYKLLIFDFDGTIADTSRGLINSHRYANVAMGRPMPSDELLSKIIGGPLLETYNVTLGYPEAEARKAIKIYRDYYLQNGINEADLYYGMEKTLEELKKRGYLLAVATMKIESFAITMLKNLGIAKYFDVIHGVDDKDTHTKASLVQLCMSELGVHPSETALVGDTCHDAKGAMVAGVDFIAVLYGFGFKSPEDVAQTKAVRSISSPGELLNN